MKCRVFWICCVFCNGCMHFTGLEVLGTWSQVDHFHARSEHFWKRFAPGLRATYLASPHHQVRCARLRQSTSSQGFQSGTRTVAPAAVRWEPKRSPGVFSANCLEAISVSCHSIIGHIPYVIRNRTLPQPLFPWRGVPTIIFSH